MSDKPVAVVWRWEVPVASGEEVIPNYFYSDCAEGLPSWEPLYTQPQHDKVDKLIQVIKSLRDLTTDCGCDRTMNIREQADEALRRYGGETKSMVCSADILICGWN